MYSLCKIGNTYISYKEKFPLYKRIEKMLSSKKKGKKNIVYIVPTYYSQSVRYRAENMVEAINRLTDCNAVIFETFNVKILLHYVEYIDVVIYVRTRYDELNMFSEMVRESGIPSYYDIDDFQFSRECVSPKEMGDTIADINSEYQKMANACDGFITTTPFLKDKLEECFGKKVYLIRNFMSSEQIDIAKNYFTIKNNSKRVEITEKFCVGYYASNSHYRDLKLVADEIVSFLKKHENVILRIGGMTKVPEILKCADIKNRVDIIPYMDGYSLMKEFAEIDVNLIPLVMDDYSQARSEIKYFEAGSVGTISVMSPTNVYCELNQKGNVGRLCEHGKWSSVLEELYNSRTRLKRNWHTLFQETINEYSVDSRKKEIHFMLVNMVGRR